MTLLRLRAYGNHNMYTWLLQHVHMVITTSTHGYYSMYTWLLQHGYYSMYTWLSQHVHLAITAYIRGNHNILYLLASLNSTAVQFRILVSKLTTLYYKDLQLVVIVL